MSCFLISAVMFTAWRCVTGLKDEFSLPTESTSTSLSAVTALKHASWWSCDHSPCLPWAALFENRVKVQKHLHQPHWAAASPARQRWAYAIIVLLQLWVCGCRSESQDHSQGLRSGPVHGSRSSVITETFPSTLPRLYKHFSQCEIKRSRFA